MAIGVDELFQMLDSESPEDVQKRGVQEAEKINYLSIFLQPVENKGVWENCAKIICSRTDEVLRHYLFWMFDWLQDANWPGFFIIYNRLKQMDVDLILSVFSYSVKTAIKTEDEAWLDYLAGFIENENLLKRIPKEHQELLKKHYENFWAYEQ